MSMDIPDDISDTAIELAAVSMQTETTKNKISATLSELHEINFRRYLAIGQALGDEKLRAAQLVLKDLRSINGILERFHSMLVSQVDQMRSEG